MITVHRLNDYKLGNSLYMLAAAIGHAEKHGFEFGLTEPWRFDHYFKNQLPIFGSKQSFKIVPEFIFSYQEIPAEDNLSISGYRQSYKYFEHCLDKIRYYFQIKDEIVDKVKAIYNKYKGIHVAAHVRLGDYHQWSTFHTNLDKTDYYERAFSKYFPGIPREYLTALVSDDSKQAESLPPFNKFQFVTDDLKLNDIEDFCLLTLSKNLIIANSSFSAFAAILNKDVEKVVAPANWFQEDGPKKWDDLYMPNWEVI